MRNKCQLCQTNALPVCQITCLYYDEHTGNMQGTLCGASGGYACIMMNIRGTGKGYYAEHQVSMPVLQWTYGEQAGDIMRSIRWAGRNIHLTNFRNVNFKFSENFGFLNLGIVLYWLLGLRLKECFEISHLCFRKNVIDFR